MTKLQVVTSALLAASFLAVSAPEGIAATNVCKPAPFERALCGLKGGHWSSVRCRCELNGSTVSRPSGSGPTSSGDGPTSTVASGGNPGNDKEKGKAGEKGMNNESPSTGTKGNSN